MATAFHLFLELPAELRLQIWESALRPAVPGVHFFSLKERPATSVGEGDRFVSHVGLGSRGYFLAPPTFAAEQQHPWGQRNPSTYLIDKELWAACRESRNVARKHFENACRKSGNSPKSCGLAGMGRCLGAPPGGWAPGVLTHRDLMCFQVAASEEQMVWKDLCDIQLMLQHVRANGNGSAPFHIALEFDGAWSIVPRTATTHDVKRQAGPRACFLFLLEMILIGLLPATLYLIDYSSSLKHGIEAAPKFRGDGCKFWEVGRRDTNRSQPGSSAGPWGFIRTVNRQWGSSLAGLKRNVWVPGRQEQQELFDVKDYVRVLVCRKD